MAATVEIYTKAFCGYCFRAKRLLDGKGAGYVEHDITAGGEQRDRLEKRLPGYRTVPQIFIGGEPVGGADDLAALERAGELDAMLAG